MWARALPQVGRWKTRWDEAKVEREDSSQFTFAVWGVITYGSSQKPSYQARIEAVK